MFNIRSIEKLMFFLILAMPLASQSSSYTPVRGSARVAKVLGYRIQVGTGPAWIEFRNIGSERIHFVYRFLLHQTREEAVGANGRVSLGANRSCWIPVPASLPPSALTTSPVRVHNLRFGEGDGGDFEAEDNESGSGK